MSAFCTVVAVLGELCTESFVRHLTRNIVFKKIKYLRTFLKNSILLCIFETNNKPTTYSNIYPTKYNVTQFVLSGNCSTCFGWYLHPSSGAQITVSTASGICHTVTAICRYRGRVGTGLSVLWVA